MNDLDWKTPALVGGLITGVFSVAPFVNFVNCCFCGWALIGGAVAANMLIGRTPRPLNSGDGAKIGLFAGLIAGGVYILLSLPLTLLGISEGLRNRMLDRISEISNDPALQETFHRMIEQSANLSMTQKVLSSLVILIPSGIVLCGFTVLGGLIGVTLFEKRKSLPPPPPPYPQNFAGNP
ncbi:MAG: hypothetical protein J2P41_21030 [Blastocatellia bacterium]|nr:hypothetical protein [Blastocatellia bacterium]